MTKIEIAVVDDDESVRESISNLMRSLGFSVSEFSSAEDFLNSNHLSRTACLITDVQMPGMNGIELHRRIVASGSPVPTVLISAYADEKVGAQALKAGVTCYLSKPVDKSKLLGCINSALEDRKKDDTSC